MWFRKQKAEKEELRSRKKTVQHPKQELTSLEKAKREYALWVLAEEYEKDEWLDFICPLKGSIQLNYAAKEKICRVYIKMP